MSRIDVPTLKCDRCDFTTQDDMEMLKFHQIYWYTGDSGNNTVEEDLCSNCWSDLNNFMANTINIKPRVVE